MAEGIASTMIWVFRCLFTITILGAGVALFFFFAGVADGTVSSFNIILWLGLLAVVVGVPATGWILHRKKFPWVALGVLLITALPALVGLFFIVLLLLFPPHWN